MAIDVKLFPDALICAIDDWQAGSGDKQRKAQTLRETSAHLPAAYRENPACTYRQMRANFQLAIGVGVDAMPDAVSSWTTSLDVAKHFREHDKDRKKVLMIFGRRPAQEDVILNLNAVYANPDFLDTVEAAEIRLGRQFKGIARWENTQQEVVLDETVVGNDNIISIGAFRQFSDVVPMIGERDPNAPSDDDIYHQLIGKPAYEHFWTSPESAQNGIRNAAEKIQKYLKDKNVWPEGLPE